MAQFRVASRASYRSESLRLSARISVSLTVHPPGRTRVGPDERLAEELGHYTTPAELRDLEAALDRYAEEETVEIREILARAGRRS